MKKIFLEILFLLLFGYKGWEVKGSERKTNVRNLRSRSRNTEKKKSLETLEFDH